MSQIRIKEDKSILFVHYSAVLLELKCEETH